MSAVIEGVGDGYRRIGVISGAIPNLPQSVEVQTPQPGDATSEYRRYHKHMTRVFLADAKSETRSAMRLLLMDMKMQVVGEAVDWGSAMARIPTTNPDMLVVVWELPAAAFAGAVLAELRAAHPNLRVVVLSSHLDARQAALRAGADAFISIGDAPDRVTERLRAAAGDSSS